MSCKNVFIGGVARSGKSTLSDKLLEFSKYNHMPVDYFTSSFKHNFPECGITSNVVIDKESSSKLALFLSRVINIIDCKDEKFIIDSAHIMPKDIMKYIDLDKWDVYYVGYPNITKEEKFDIIRKYDDESDWTFKRSDEELLEILENLIELSKEIEEECLKYNIKFIDTSFDIKSSIDELFK